MLSSSDLNEKQLMAANYLDGSLLILSGAGTGKTKTVISRISNIVQAGKALPANILAVTFTNKAAREMQNRISAIYAESPIYFSWIGTFHSLALKILKNHYLLVGLKENFTIIDQNDQVSLIKKIIKNNFNQEIDRKISKNVLSIIQQSKDNLAEPKGYGEIIKLAKDVYPVYQSQLLMNNCIDFSDILYYNLQIFRQYPDVLDYYREQFLYVTVDEYQDTNELQYQWLLSLINDEQNICCVGDDDQSIYQWRGAKIDKILNFQQDFPNAKLIRLEQNYRSTKYILAAAYSIISNNKNRLDKEIWTDLSKGIKVKVLIFGDDYHEARYIIDFASKVEKFSDVAILLRTTMQTRLFEEQCIKTNTPYVIVGGTKFYDRREIKDVLAYLRIVYNNNDDMALDRIINLPKRGIGNITLDKLQLIAMEENNSLMIVLIKLLGISSNLINDRLAILIEQINNWQSQLNVLTLRELTKLILDESGYMEMLKVTKEDEERIQNINELINSMDRYSNLEEFLEYISLINDHIEHETEENNKGYISISTIHAAKGLEFRYVFLPGWEEGLFPHSRAIKSSEEEVEEERRLAYVGLTRAKELVCISYCKERRSMYQSTFGIPSRFIKELNKNAITIINKI